MGSGWGDGHRDCRGGFWLVTSSSKPQPALVNAAETLSLRRCAKHLPRVRR
jgi:hypothetical protein